MRSSEVIFMLYNLLIYSNCDWVKIYPTYSKK